jgi:NAD(P)-dependent dehydrogenase (short-subunit alcohol dehydrogenase family)
MELDLRGKVALVRRSSRGLGRTCAEQLAEGGAAVVVCGPVIFLATETWRDRKRRGSPKAKPGSITIFMGR